MGIIKKLRRHAAMASGNFSAMFKGVEIPPLPIAIQRLMSELTLGPSAFILFYTPLSESACPRNLILSHTVAVLSGLGALALTEMFFPGFRELSTMTLNWPGVMAIAIAMGGASIAMVAIHASILLRRPQP